MPISLGERIRRHVGRDPQRASRREVYLGLVSAVREAVLERWVATEAAWDAANQREVAYLSMEFHVGRLLRTSLVALGLEAEAEAALAPFKVSVSELEEEESDARLGSGGLGRLAACFLDSLACLDLPGRGYGLRFELGLFKQSIEEGKQVERPDPWLDAAGSWPWEIARENESVEVGFGGHVEFNHKGELRCNWKPDVRMRAIPYDLPVAAFGSPTVGTLRLWRAEALDVPPLDGFVSGDYAGAWATTAKARSLTTYLYPPDSTEDGRELRLCQQHLLASASIQDLLRRYGSPQGFRERCVAQLNDTHPVLAIPELMRLLLDEHGLGWEESWEITREVFAYTNHTLLPEALETWSVELLGRVLPRHLQLIEEIDRRFQEDVRRDFSGDRERVERMAIIDAKGGNVRMAHLAVVSSRHINGVAALHTRLMREGLFGDFNAQDPSRFSNKTNGITPRRWLIEANPGLSALLNETIGTGWQRDLALLRELEPFAEDAAFRAKYRAVKLANKQSLAAWCEATHDLPFDPASLLDVQVKRFHEYKRQLLLALWVVSRALELERGEAKDAPPRTVLFGGKAAATYDAAKRVIELIHAVAASLERNPATRGRLRIVFVPDYKVSVAQRIIPAADLSEQISTAGYEASGTGNMKLSLNGALTIGTLDGANVEILEDVGEEHVVVFGLDPAGVRRVQAEGPGPRDLYERDPALREVLDAVASYKHTAPGFPHLVRELLQHDPYCVLADFPAYCEAQRDVDRRFLDPEGWTRSAILTTARMARFSSDRTIQDYARDVWRITPVTFEADSRAALGGLETTATTRLPSA